MSPILDPETIVLITGANQGLGYECVKKLAAEQSNYRIIIGSRDLAKGQAAASSVTKMANNTSIEAVQLDVTSDESINAAVNLIESKYHRLDVLFNNAGIMFVTESTPRAEFRKILETNTIGAACVTEAFVPLLTKAVCPRLLFMSSGLGSLTLTTLPCSPFYGYDFKAYSTSKAGVNMIGLLYAKQLRKSAFKVNLVDPGFRQTNLNGFHNEGGDPAGGASEACRLIADASADGQHGSFAATEGPVPW
jgi:NAD(P)-dependent dehydrogenase (short-subunit alcohol dehydrogenase family)